MSRLFRAVLIAAIVLSFSASVTGQAQAPAPASPPSQSAPATPADPGPSTGVQPEQPILNTPEMAPDETGTGLKLARAVESFSDLSLKGSELRPVPPLLGSRETLGNFTRELWQVRWRPNDPIDLWVILPRGVKNPPVVLYLYGYPSETARFRNIEYCDRIVHGGAAAVGFVSAYDGHRTDFHPLNQTFMRKLPEAVVSTVHDVQMVLDYLQSRGDLDMSRVGIFGQGSGGAIAMLTASVEPRLKVLDLLDPWGDWPDWFAGQPDSFRPSDRAEFLKQDFQKSLEPIEPLHYLPQLTSQKIRLQFDADSGEPKQAADRIAAAAPSQASVVRFASSREMYSINSGGRLFQWIAEQLGAHPIPPAPPKAPTSEPAQSPRHP